MATPPPSITVTAPNVPNVQLWAAAPNVNAQGTNLGIGSGVFAYANGANLFFNTIEVTGSLGMQVVNGTMVISGSAAAGGSYDPLGTAANTGQILYNDIVGLSGLLIASSAGVSTLNSLSGSITLLSSGYITFQTGGGTITLGITGLATATNLTQSGSIIYADIVGLSGTLLSTLNATGNQLYTDITGLSGQAAATYATISNLQSTGQSLYGELTGLSGQANTNFATVANLQSTGQTLYTDLTGLSGQASTNFATIANLASTGTTLYNDLTGLSGAAANSYATQANLASTGSSLYALVTGLSGQDVTNYATKISLTNSGALLSAIEVTGSSIISVANFTGAGGTLVYTSGGYIFISGAGGGGGSYDPLGTAANTGQILYNDLTGLSGALSVSLGLTGSALIALINSAAAGVSSLNGLSGILNLQSSGYLTFATGAGAITIGVTGLATAVNLATTGSNLYVDITGLSGAFNTALASTGQQAWSAGNSAGTNLSGQLTTTGQNLLADIVGLSGALNTTIASTGSILYVDLTGLSGQFNTNLATAANLASTGSTLYVDLTGMSGQANTNYATVLNLASTGSTLYVDLTNMSGALNATVASTGSALYIDLTGLSGAHNTAIASTGQLAWTAAQNNATNLSGNLTTTGINLLADIVSLSGAAIGNSLVQQVIFNQGGGVLSGVSGHLWINSSGSLVVGASGNMVPNNLLPTNPIAAFGSGTGAYIQVSVQNVASGISSSSDFVATADNGNDNNGYIDIGINSSQYNQAAFNIGSGNDGYVYVNSGALSIGTATPGKVLRFHTDGTTYANLRAIVSSSGIQVFGSGIFSSGISIPFIYLSGQQITANNSSIFLNGAAIGAGGGTSVQITGSSILTTANFSGIGGTLVFTSGGYVLVSGAGGGGGSYDPLGTAANTGQILYADLTGLSGVTNSNFNPFPKYTGIFNITPPIYRYMWSGISGAPGTGIMPSSSTASGAEYLLKNIDSGSYLTISGTIDYQSNYVLNPLASVTLISNNDSWILV